MSAIPHVLVVDDDQEIRKLLARYLEGQGFKVSLAGNRREFTEHITTDRIELVLLDILLPDGSGLDICAYLRQRTPHVAVILMTGLKEEVDRIIGLELGADDYLGKPFNPRELLARVRAVLRRSRTGGAVNVVSAPPTSYRFAGLRVDVASRTVTSPSGQVVDLTGAEFELLRVFLDRPGRVLSRDQLLEHTQGREAGPYDRSVDVLMSRIRKKLGGVTRETLFKTVRNGGYQLVVRVDSDGDP